MKTQFLVCAKCGMRDSSTRAGSPRGYVGTSVKMRCNDCGIGMDAHPHALLCRMCCPTGHGTRYDEVTERGIPTLSQAAGYRGPSDAANAANAHNRYIAGTPAFASLPGTAPAVATNQTVREIQAAEYIVKHEYLHMSGTYVYVVYCAGLCLGTTNTADEMDALVAKLKQMAGA